MRLLRLHTALRGLIGGVLILSGISCGTNEENSPSTATEEIRIFIDPIGLAPRITREQAAAYEEKTGIKVVLSGEAMDSSARLTQVMQILGSRSTSVDIIQIDVIWPDLLADHLVDLSDALGSEREKFFKPNLENNTIGGRLVAIPWYADAGLLYYRTDLLEKYGFKQPPVTWDELELMAKTIQDGERAAGNADFNGFLFHGAAREGLTCNGLEWQASQGGGTIIDADGRITINNPKAAAAFDRARSWIGTISPPAVLLSSEVPNREEFQAGKAAFLRSWNSSHTRFTEKNSFIADKFSVTILPAGSERQATALGGWQLAVSKYSKNQEAAIDFVRWLTSAEGQAKRAIDGSFPPTRHDVYAIPEVIEKQPHLAAMPEIFRAAVNRPSSIVGPSYNEISTIYFTQLHQVLEGRINGTQAVEEMERQMRRVLERE